MYWREANKNVTTKLKESISLHPNPTNKILKVKLENSTESGQIEIVDLNGRVIQKLPINNDEKSDISIDVTEYTSSVYMLRWTSNGIIIIKSFTVKFTFQEE